MGPDVQMWQQPSKGPGGSFPWYGQNEETDTGNREAEQLRGGVLRTATGSVSPGKI